MKKLMVLAAMLAMVAAAAIPALAQDNGQDAGNAGENSGGSVVANTTPSTGGSADDNLSYNANPAPADGSSETSVPTPTKGFESGGCSDADKISLRSAPEDNGGDDSGSVTAAPTPGCSYVVIEE
jgi:hypothetical protein